MASVDALPSQNLSRSARNPKNDGSTKAAHAAKCCQLPKVGDENQDPNARVRSTKTVATEKRAGISRLPVSIRSQKLRHQPNLCQTQKTLEGTSKDNVLKQPCTKAVPFGSSQTQAKEALESKKPEALPLVSLAARCPARLPPAKPLRLAQCPTPPVSGPSSAVSSLHVATAVLLPTPEPSESANLKTLRTVQESSQIVPGDRAGPTPLCRINPTAQTAAPISHNSGNSVPFCPDPTALQSILQNEGVKTRVPPIMPQRVSVLKSQHRVGAKAGSVVQFTPDAAALLSILQNSGIKEGESLMATPNGSVCCTLRGSSVYLPQRVPVTKSHGGPVGMLSGLSTECSQTPTVRFTPQRVPNTRPQYTKQLFSSHRTPIFRNTPKMKGIQSCSQELEAHKEENIVQRLFEDAELEEEPSSSLGLSGQQRRKNTEGSGLVEKKVIPPPESADEEKNSKQPEVQPFVQAAHRGSVIVFAQAKKLLSMTSAEKSPQVHVVSAPLEPCTSKQELVQAMEEQLKIPFVPAIPWQSHNASGVTARGFPCSADSVTSTLRHRFQTLGEALLDEECAMYTSCQLNSAVQPDRCVNPVAATLDFQDSTCFAPIALPPMTLPKPTVP